MQLPTFYDEILNHPHTSDELRRSTEAKLFRYKLAHLRAVAPDSEDKIKLLNTVQEMARGAVLLGVNDELAWVTFIELLDASRIGWYLPLQYDILDAHSFY